MQKMQTNIIHRPQVIKLPELKTVNTSLNHEEPAI